jgi:hypothetical protein
MPNVARHRLTLLDYSDRELLNLMMDEAGEDGWASVHDLAVAIGIDAKHPGQHVGIRLGWMRRYGAVERQNGAPMWRPTPMGRALARGDLSEDQREVIEGLTSEQMLTLTRTLTTRYRRVGDTAAHLMRREWQYGTHGRRFG